MKRKQLGIAAALAAGTLAATGLALAPTAAAVTPLTATINATCTIGGGGAATLTATQNGTAATITLSSTSITSPLPLSQDTIASTLTMAKGSGGTVVFTGTKNPAIPLNGGVTVGPLNGTVASGDSLDLYGGSLKMVIFGITVTCTATAHQLPGPFVFS